MDGALVDRQRRLLHRLGERRVGVAGAGDVLGRGAELHGNRSLRDHVAGVRPDDVHAEHAVGLGIGEDFHEAFGLQVRLCAAIGGKRKLAGIVGDAGLLQFLLAFFDRGDFGIGVDYVWDDVVVHLAGFAGEDFRHRRALVHGLVRQHRAGDRVADGVDARHVGGEARVDHDAALVVRLHPGGFEAEPLGKRHAPDRYQHDIGFDGFCRAAGGRLDCYFKLLSRRLDAGHLGRKLEDDTLLLKHALHLPADFAIHSQQDAVEDLDHDHLGAETAPHRAELEPDHASADDEQPLRHLLENQSAGRGHDAPLVDIDAGQACHVRAGGDDDRLAFDGLAPAVSGLHLDLAGCNDAAGAVKGVDLVLLEQEGDALDIAVNALVLEFHHGGKIELRLADLDAHLVEQMAGLFVELGGVQQRLGGNATDVEAGAAEGLVLFDYGNLHAELCRADGADIAAGAGADDDEIVGHDYSELSVVTAADGDRRT